MAVLVVLGIQISLSSFTSTSTAYVHLIVTKVGSNFLLEVTRCPEGSQGKQMVRTRVLIVEIQGLAHD